MLCHGQRAYEIKGCNLFSPCVRVSGLGGTLRIVRADKQAAVYGSPFHGIRYLLRRWSEEIGYCFF